MLVDRLTDAVHNARAVGAAAGTTHKGAREYAAAGAAFPGHEMTPQTPVRIASITKPMVAMAVFMAFRTELDALDASLSEHLPELKPQWRLGDDVTCPVLSPSGRSPTAPDSSGRVPPRSAWLMRWSGGWPRQC